MPEQPFLTIFFKKQCFKKSHLNTNEEGSGFRWTPTPSFSGKWGIRKLNQTDGEKGLLKRGIYIGATPCKNLANIKKQQKYIDWVPTDLPLVVRGLKNFLTNIVQSLDISRYSNVNL